MDIKSIVLICVLIGVLIGIVRVYRIINFTNKK